MALKDFIQELENIKLQVSKKYTNLFKQHGLDADWIEKLTE